MNEALFGIVGLVLGSLGTVVFFLLRRGRAHSELASARSRAEMIQAQSEQHLQEISMLRDDLAHRQDKHQESEKQLAAFQEKLAVAETKHKEQRELLDQARVQLGDAFAALGAKALEQNSESFLKLARTTFEKLMTEAKGDVEKRREAIEHLVKPVRELLEKQNTAVTEIEKKREVAYKGLEEQIKEILRSNEKLDRETGRLVTALRRPEQRGKWGEMQLRNVVELAGMMEHVDFDEQVQTDDALTRDRPDMIVHMPGEGVIVVDAKVALDAYLDALQPDADRDAQMRRHAEHVQTHFKRLASKEYWKQFDRTPKLVVMFMPLESALVAALEIKPDLHAEAMASHVLIATPTLLVALLRAIAYGWQQEDVAAGAKEIADVGKDLYDRLAKFVDHFSKVGVNLDKATRSYNSAIGSLESRILPSTRRLRDLHATTADELACPGPLEIETRPITAAELVAPPREDVTP